VKLSTALKHLFIPHEHNDYKPHFFREISVAIIVVGSIFMLGFSFGSSFLIHRTVLGASVTANVLVDLTNESRLAYNEDPLARSTVLDKAAGLKANDMATNQYFSHNSPTGVTPWHWFQEAGYTFLYAGENLAINFLDADEVRDAWLASPTHRANLLDVKFKEIGMATVSGVYKDGPTIYVVQLFGTPAVARTPEAAVSAPAETATKEEEPVKVAVATAPQIKGEQKSNAAATTSAATPTPALSSVVNTPQFAVVRNNETTEVPATMPAEKYSTWYERTLFGGTYYVGIILKILLGIVLIALVTMLTIELRKQHWKHIAYGLSLLLIISMCVIINQSFW
jgi:uncharacterized membrane protein